MELYLVPERSFDFGCAKFLCPMVSYENLRSHTLTLSITVNCEKFL